MDGTGGFDGKDEGRLAEVIGVIVSVGAEMEIEVDVGGTADVLVVAVVEYNEGCCCCCVTMASRPDFLVVVRGDGIDMRTI